MYSLPVDMVAIDITFWNKFECECISTIHAYTGIYVPGHYDMVFVAFANTTTYLSKHIGLWESHHFKALGPLRDIYLSS